MASSENEDNETDKGNLPIPSLLDVLRGLQAGRGAREPPANNSTLESSVHLGDNCSARNDYDPPNNDSDSDSLDGLILSTPVKGSPSTKKAIRKRKGQAKGQRTKQRKRQERDAKADNVAQQAKAQEQLRLDLEKKLDMERQAKEQEERQEALKEREDAMNSVAHLFSQSLTLGDFLSWVFPTDERLEGTNEPGLVGERSLGVSAEWRWTQFFRGPNLRRLLNFWSSARSPMTVRKTMDDFAVQRVIDLVQKEAKSVTESKMLWSQKAEVNEEFVLGFNYQNIHEKLTKELAPVSMQLIHQMATSRRQEKDGISAQRAERKLHVMTSSYLSLVGEHSKSNSRSRQILGLYLYATGAQRQCISVLCQLGIGCGYTTLTRVSSILSTGQAPTHRLEIAGGGGEEDSCIDNSSGNTGRQRQPESQGCASRHFTSAQRDGQEMTSDMGAISTNASGEAVDSSTTENQSDLPSDCTEGQDGGGLIRKLSQYCRSAAQQLAQSLLYLTVYDNVNMSDKVAEQVLGRKDNPINGTCATVIKLHNASEESLLSSSVDEAFQSAKPLTFEDIDFTESERLVWDKFMLNTFLRIVTTYGGTPLERFQKHVEADTPVSHSKIALHKSEIHPLPALEIDESSITGNIEVLEAITEELGLDATSPDFMRHVRLFAGDQLSVSRLRSIARYRAGHEGGFQSFKWPITIPGLFHLKMAATQGVLETFFGKPNSSHRNPGSLHHHNLVLDRKPIVLTSLPPFRITRDLIFHSLYARVLRCLLQVSNHSTLKDLNDDLESYESLKLIAQKALDTFSNTRKVAEMRNQRKISKLNPSSPPAGDMVLESAMLFLRDALALRAFTDAIKSGDSGFVLLSLKNLAFAFRANGRTKYAHEILFVLHNLTHVWPPKLRKLVLDNWLVNTTGRANAWIELDLLQEHLNFWIKVIYKAHGSNASWEWLATISPCIDILRKLTTQMHVTLGTRQGSRHQAPDITRDINVLMDDLAARRVYVYEAGREFDDDDPPPRDVITEGAISLISGGESSPLAQYNATFNTLRRRCAVPVLVGSGPIPNASAGTSRPSEPSLPSAPTSSESTRPVIHRDGQDSLDQGRHNHREEVGSGVGVREPSESGESSDGEAGSVASDEEGSVLGEDTLVEYDGNHDASGGELALEAAEDVALEMDAEEVWDEDEDEESLPFD